MIKSITVKNWKSFEKLEYKFQSINILLGNNSSGKSNFLDLLEFISLASKNASLEEINKIRGGITYLTRINEPMFGILVKVDVNGKIHDAIFGIQDNEVVFSIDVDIRKSLSEQSFNINKENLELMKDFVRQTKGKMTDEEAAEFIDKLKEKSHEIDEQIRIQDEIETEITRQLSNINVIDPTPSLIRGTTKHENKELLKDCSNLISFVAGIEEKEKQNIESKLLEYLRKLTFSDIQSVNFKFLGENKEFAQLYVEENGIKLHSDIISDGMLRFIAIIVALMTQKSDGILAIEEIDNGIAPYQLKMLMNIIDEISFEKKFDVVFTTHNHLLMNYLGDEYMDFVFYVSKKNGKSSIKRIKDYPSYGKISSYGKLGDLIDNEEILNLLNAQGDIDEA